METVQMAIVGAPGIAQVCLTAYVRYRQRLVEQFCEQRGAATTDARVQALVEVGAIPYRENYHVRYTGFSHWND